MKAIVIYGSNNQIVQIQTRDTPKVNIANSAEKLNCLLNVLQVLMNLDNACSFKIVRYHEVRY